MSEKVKVIFEVSKDLVRGMVAIIDSTKVDEIIKHVQEENFVDIEAAAKQNSDFKDVPNLIAMILVADISQKHNV